MLVDDGGIWSVLDLRNAWTVEEAGWILESARHD